MACWFVGFAVCQFPYKPVVIKRLERIFISAGCNFFKEKKECRCPLRCVCAKGEKENKKNIAFA